MVNAKSDWYIKAAALLVRDWHKDESFLDVSIPDTYLPLVDRILCDNGYAKNHSVRAAAYLHLCTQGKEVEEQERRLAIIHDDFPQQTYDIVAAFTSAMKYELDRDSEIMGKILNTYKGPDVLAATRIVRAMIAALKDMDELRRLAKQHDNCSTVMQRMVSEKLWLCLEQAFPDGTITKRQPLMLQLGFADVTA